MYKITQSRVSIDLGDHTLFCCFSYTAAASAFSTNRNSSGIVVVDLLKCKQILN